MSEAFDEYFENNLTQSQFTLRMLNYFNYKGPKIQTNNF